MAKSKTMRKRISNKKRNYKKRSYKKRGGGILATVGKPIGSEPSTWPGVSAPHDGNHYSLNQHSHLPFSKIGGRRKKLRKMKTKKSKKMKTKKSKKLSKKYKQKGGSSIFRSFFPETSLVYDNTAHAYGSAVNTFKGHTAPIDPKPWSHPELLKVQQRMI